MGCPRRQHYQREQRHSHGRDGLALGFRERPQVPRNEFVGHHHGGYEAGEPAGHRHVRHRVHPVVPRCEHNVQRPEQAEAVCYAPVRKREHDNEEQHRRWKHSLCDPSRIWRQVVEGTNQRNR